MNNATPRIEIRLDVIERNYRRLQNAFGNSAGIFYAVKANNNPDVVRALARFGSGFDVASQGEIEFLHDSRVRGRRTLFSNPVKTPAAIRVAANAGIRRFAIDSEDEIAKIASIVPKAEVYVRVEVPNEGSGWPLSKKFGVGPEGALALLRKARHRGLIPIGLTFHVGSQCTVARNWASALDICAGIWQQAVAAGITTLSLLDLGGGFPAAYIGQVVPTPEEIAAVVFDRVHGRFEGLTELALEPGRYLVADAGTLHASVIGVTKRKDEQMVYLDTGAFNGMMETTECFWYTVNLHPKDGGRRPMRDIVLMGPSCDSVDVITKSLPKRQLRMPLPRLGDQISFGMAGAYTNSYQSYNGMKYPDISVLGAREERSNVHDLFPAKKTEAEAQSLSVVIV